VAVDIGDINVDEEQVRRGFPHHVDGDAKVPVARTTYPASSRISRIT